MSRVILISIGDELLVGQTINTNAAWLGDQLTSIGWTVDRVIVIADDEATIVNEIATAASHADAVIVSGGLGPTHDDKTRDALCRLLDCELEVDVEQLERIERRFHERGIQLNERSRRQALSPSKCRRLPNFHGSAPGLAFRHNTTPVYVLPGVPAEMRGITSDFILAELSFASGTIERRTFLMFGITESALADLLHPLDSLLTEGITLAYLPSPGGIRVRAMLFGDDPLLRSQYDELIHGIEHLAAAFIVSDRDETLVDVVGRALGDRGQKLATVESCTGGLVGELITEVPGASNWYLGGIVSYANSVKSDIVGVSPDLIAQNGAVSETVALHMARSGRERLRADVCVAITGIAGPDGGTPEKPVGTVFIAVDSARGGVAIRCQFGAGRRNVRERAAYAALDLVRRTLLQPPA